MPNAIFPAGQRDAGRSRLADTQRGLRLWLRTRWKRRRLDDALSRGAKPAESAELTLRAGQLRSTAVRSQLAYALERTLNEARRLELLTLRFSPHRAAIRDCEHELLALVLRLRDERPVHVRGAAMSALLVNMVASPLEPDRAERLRRALRSAWLALDIPAEPRPDRRHAASEVEWPYLRHST